MVMAWVSFFLILLSRRIQQLSTRRSLTRLIFFQTLKTYKNLWFKYGKFNSLFSFHKGPFSQKKSLYKMQPFFLLPNGKISSPKKSLIMGMVEKYVYFVKLQSNMCSMAQGILKLPSHLVLGPLVLACLTLNQPFIKCYGTLDHHGTKQHQCIDSCNNTTPPLSVKLIYL